MCVVKIQSDREYTNPAEGGRQGAIFLFNLKMIKAYKSFSMLKIASGKAVCDEYLFGRVDFSGLSGGKDSLEGA